MTPLVVVITAQQLARLNQLCASSGFTQDAQVGALVDLEWEEWTEPDDAIIRDASRSTRFARFVAQDGAK